ncbi:MAG: FAD-binding protein, partial [Blautia sp.]|nr:FAD-binding protein [Blautia sp.]
HHGEDKEGMTNYLMHRYNGYKQGDTYMDGEYPNPKAISTYVENVYPSLKWLETKGVAFNFYDAEEEHGSGDTTTDESVVEGVSSYRHIVPWGEVKEDGTVETAYTWLAYAHYQEPDREPNVSARAMEKLFNNFTENGGTILLSTPATGLLTDESGAVVGVEAESKEAHYTIHAKSVVLCAGGYGASPEAIAEWMPTYVGETNITLPGNTGDGIRMVLSVGAVLFDDQFMMGGSGHTVITDEDLISQWRDAETPGAALIVNPFGQRVNSETPESYSNSAMHVNPDSRDYYWIIVNEDVAKSNNVLENIYDENSVVGTYQDMLEEQLSKGDERFFKADTIQELSKEIGIVPVNLMYTLHHYNALCDKGEDTDLFKSPENMVKMEDGPWYAVKAYMSYFGTVGGVVTDGETAAVLYEDGTPIPGLYAAGETSNHNMFNLTYLGGFSLGECLTFGRIAGTNAGIEALAK